MKNKSNAMKTQPYYRPSKLVAILLLLSAAFGAKIASLCLLHTKPRIKCVSQSYLAAVIAVIAAVATMLMGQRANADSYTNVMPNGYSLIANQLDHGSNTADVVFPNPTGA